MNPLRLPLDSFKFKIDFKDGDFSACVKLVVQLHIREDMEGVGVEQNVGRMQIKTWFKFLPGAVVLKRYATQRHVYTQESQTDVRQYSIK